MKKEILIHTISFILLFLLFSFLKGWISINYWPLWVGGLIGTILPDVDHIIYVYYLRPNELTSQRAIYMSQKGELLKTWQLLASTRSERRNLILHTTLFQIIFVILAFLVLTSSASLIGRGIVLAFLLHLTIDQIVDYQNMKTLSNWIYKLNLVLDNTQTVIYLVSSLAILLIFSILM
ncbi:MAG TPA: hypothetical protein VF185_02530 [Patescibacteria group bacterium]